jgi:AraC family transcriptional regulator
MEDEAPTVPAELRPVSIRIGSGIRPAVIETPRISSGPLIWPAYFFEELRIDESGIPSGSSLVADVVVTIVSSTERNKVYWREGGRERFRYIHAGDVFVRSAQELVDFRWTKPMVMRILGIRHDKFVTLASDLVTERACEFKPTNAEPDPLVGDLMNQLAANLMSGCPTGGLFGESFCATLGYHALRRYGSSRLKRREYKTGLPARTLARVIDYVLANLATDLTIEDLAAVAGITPWSFQKLFHKSLHRPIHEFVLDARMRTARDLLGKRSLSLAAVASTVGFCHQSHFTQAFRRRLGVTPAEFRLAAGRNVDHP